MEIMLGKVPGPEAGPAKWHLLLYLGQTGHETPDPNRGTQSPGAFESGVQLSIQEASQHCSGMPCLSELRGTWSSLTVHQSWHGTLGTQIQIPSLGVTVPWDLGWARCSEAHPIN